MVTVEGELYYYIYIYIYPLSQILCNIFSFILYELFYYSKFLLKQIYNPDKLTQAGNYP